MNKTPIRPRIESAMAELLAKATIDHTTELTISKLARTANVARGTIYKHSDLLDKWTRDVRKLELNHLNLAKLQSKLDDTSQQLKRLKNENRQLRAQLKSIQTVAAEMSAILSEIEQPGGSRVVQFKRKS